MNDWLREMELRRHELLHYKKVISDEEFAEILLGNASQTHRDVVRQFSKHYDVLASPGLQRSAPSATQVMNALRAECELDARIQDDVPHGQNISSADKKQSQQKGKNKKRGRGKGKGKAIKRSRTVQIVTSKAERKMVARIFVSVSTVTRPVISILTVQPKMMSQTRCFQNANGGKQGGTFRKQKE
ncbi:hypothetical protein PHMEG_00018006 [Phytophthora megakarya]|uniref:Uncharacterized protein n=1 Tax=Phytophthora megakarya TaxID=4795 RepID=A0A225VXL4_9STRA|nr:hypothetical protein PHMEG_00018006 [Phytophthora megakarya]